MEKYNEGIRKNSDGIADEIRKAERQLDLLLRKAKSALIGLNIELREEDVERSSPIALHSASLAAATAALGSLPRRVVSDRTVPSEDYWPGAELHDGEIEEPPVETVIGRQGPGLNHALRQKDGRGDPPGWSLNEEGP